MLLQRLAIFGFKSFAEKTELQFGEGITAVIGPNGCGKSNVVDALRWVFGEQRASVLRSTTMQDVIFSGSEKRQSLNMAEVTLTISNSKGILPLEYSEIAITRRIFRNGESEYLINKTLSRLKDIQDLFLDTGIGTSVYTTIENSMINKILSDKAEERRMLFEEAAGIGKFKHRIKESIRKLDRTRQDLLRINDRAQEKEKYVRLLGRQVEKAQKYKHYFEELKKLELGYEHNKFQLLTNAISKRLEVINDLEKSLQTQRQKITDQDSHIEQREKNKQQKEQHVESLGKKVMDTTDKLNSLEREISITKQSISFIQQNLSRFDQEIESNEQLTIQKQELLNSLEKGLINKQQELQGQRSSVDQTKLQLQEFDSRISSKREQTQELVQRQLDSVHQLGEKRKELGTTQTNLSNSIERLNRDEQELKRLESHVTEAKKNLMQCKKDIVILNENMKMNMHNRDTLRSRVEQEEAAYHTHIEAEKRLGADIDSTKAKLRFLEGLDAAFEGYSTGVKALLEKKLPGIVGTIADLIDVKDATMVKLVEKVLEITVQTVVFQTDRECEQALEFLMRQNVGTAPVLSLETIQTHSTQTIHESFATARCMADFISPKPGAEHLITLLFDHIYVCNTTQEALALQKTTHEHCCFVSREGTICHANGIIVCGEKKKQEIGILQRKQEIDRLKMHSIKSMQEYESVKLQKAQCIKNRDESKKSLIEIEEMLTLSRQKYQEQLTNSKHYENEISTIEDRISRITSDMSTIKNTVARLEIQSKGFEDSIRELTNQKTTIEDQLNSMRALLHEMESQRNDYADQVKNVELSFQSLFTHVNQDKKNIDTLKHEIILFSSNKQKKFEEKNRNIAEMKKFNEKLIQAQESSQQASLQREAVQEEFNCVRKEYLSMVSEIEESRKQLRLYQSELENLLKHIHEATLEQAKDDEQQRSIREKIFNTYEIDFLAPKEELPLLDLNIDENQIIENINVLRDRLKRVGEVNLGATKEFEQENMELSDMLKQRDDLQNGVDELEGAIKKLNKQARLQFLDTFELVRVKFVEMFTTLFEGGEAALILEDHDDPLEAAIKIDVRPVGKKMRGVTLLSGGERALTAISLLFALYMVKPSAYCVLDELDAPLDDANVDRFVRIVKKFADRTQFIIITHNKRTMEIADLLYGVTQQESGVSTILSVHLADILEKAAA